MKDAPRANDQTTHSAHRTGGSLDIVSIWEYIATDNEAAAERMLARFTDTYEKLASNPGIGISQDHYRAGLRCFPVGHYLVFYLSTAVELQVLRVLHGARDIPTIMRNGD